MWAVWQAEAALGEAAGAWEEMVGLLGGAEGAAGRMEESVVRLGAVGEGERGRLERVVGAGERRAGELVRALAESTAMATAAVEECSVAWEQVGVALGFVWFPMRDITLCFPVQSGEENALIAASCIQRAFVCVIFVVIDQLNGWVLQVRECEATMQGLRGKLQASLTEEVGLLERLEGAEGERVRLAGRVEELEADLCREAGELGTRLGAVERERGALERALGEERGMREKVGVGMCLTWAGRGIGGRNEIEGRRNEISGSNLALGGDVRGV
jgi:hypothetical protein